jgi:hypothetical protein
MLSLSAWSGSDYAASFATCKLLGQFGGAPVASGFAALVGLHDETTRAASALPLA